MLNGGQMVGPSASNHGQWLPNFSSHTINWWDENSKVVGNSSRTNRNSTITASNIRQPFLWIISLTASVFVVLLKKPQNLFIFRGGGLKYFGSIYKQQTETGLFMNINYTHSILRLPIMKSPAALDNFQQKKMFQNKMCNILSHNLLWNLSKHSLQNRLISRSVMQVLIYKPQWLIPLGYLIFGGQCS